jgi:SMI1-KNR4 cell-wall
MFDHITIVGGPLRRFTHEEVDAVERQFGIQLPHGYREYVTQFGDGVLGGCYVRIYPPQRILRGDNNVMEWRERIRAYWFWGDDATTLTKSQALESIIIGDTLGGDELVVHPSRPERIYVLPRNFETIFVAGDGLPDAIEWLCSSGELTEAFAERNFEL